MTTLELAALIGVLALSSQRSQPVQTPSGRKEVMDLITRVAMSHDVDPAIALAFAWLESRFDPSAEGDLQWPSKRPEMYRQAVLENPRLADNPYRNIPAVWHSYGLFQLLAPYHVRGAEHPSVLLQPDLNAERGIIAIRNRLELAHGDPYAARLAFAGCGLDGSRCNAETVAMLRARLRGALERFGYAG